MSDVGNTPHVMKAIQVEDIDKMRFRSDIQPDIDKWIHQDKMDVVELQKNILYWSRKYVGLTELCNPNFEDSDSLNIPCVLDNNYLCTVTSCTTVNSYYKTLRVVWPGGREEKWMLNFWDGPHDKMYIDRIHYIDVWKKKATVSAGMHALSGSDDALLAPVGGISALLRQMKSQQTRATHA